MGEGEQSRGLKPMLVWWLVQAWQSTGGLLWAFSALLLDAQGNKLVPHGERRLSGRPAGCVVSRPPLEILVVSAFMTSKNGTGCLHFRGYFWCLAGTQKAPLCSASHSPKLSCNLSRASHSSHNNQTKMDGGEMQVAYHCPGSKSVGVGIP